MVTHVTELVQNQLACLMHRSMRLSGSSSYPRGLGDHPAGGMIFASPAAAILFSFRSMNSWKGRSMSCCDGRSIGTFIASNRRGYEPEILCRQFADVPRRLRAEPIYDRSITRNNGTPPASQQHFGSTSCVRQNERP